MKVEPDLKMEFGKFGGMYVPDPFSPALEKLAKRASEVVATTEFIKYRTQVLDSLAVEVPTIIKVGEIKNAEVFKIKAPIFELVISGYLALAKCLELKPSFAAFDEKKLRILVKGAETLDLKAYLALSKKLAQNTQLIEQFQKSGQDVDARKCVELFDDPILYAFQYFISNIGNALYVPSAANSGPYPFPSLTISFASGFTKIVKEYLKKEFAGSPAAILAASYPGTSAIAAFKACENCDARLISVEPAFEFDRYDCYCGQFTKVVKVGEEERVLCPELVFAWESSEVDRVYANDFTTALAAMDIQGKVLIVEDC